MLNRSKLYAVTLLAVVFGAGTAVGGAASAAWGDRGEERETKRDRRERRSYTDRLQEDLGLSVTQRDSIEQILTVYQQSMSDLWSEVRPRMQAIRTEVRSDIAAILDENQQIRYAERNARVDSARAARSNGRRERGGTR